MEVKCVSDFSITAGTRSTGGFFFGVRAEPLAYGAPEQVDLELYLMWRARGMPLETPAVRP